MNEVKITDKDIFETSADMIVIYVCEEKTKQLYGNTALLKVIKEVLKLKEFEGKKDDSVLLYKYSGFKSERILFCGVGKREKTNVEVFRSVAGLAVRKANNLKMKTVCFATDFALKNEKQKMSRIKGIIEGACLANYCFNAYKSPDNKSKTLETIEIICTPKKKQQKFKQLADNTKIVCESVFLARDWINTPSNDKKPASFVKMILKSVKSKNLKIALFNKQELKKLNMNGILAVGAGSSSSPVMLVLEYNPPNPKKSIIFVGKGVTFDSGGINLKPTDAISDMKMDMSGAAATAAILSAVSKLKLPNRVIGIIPIVENMPSGSAVHPGDIIKTYSGKTVEIENTDAEGRVILCDALAFAEKNYKPDIIIDMATLTGACMVALGTKIAGVFSFDKELASQIVSAGEATFERCWAMPMPEDYKKLMKSNVADIKNLSSTKWGGAITGALFLSEFIEKTKWAHIDIAGPAYGDKEEGYILPGGTGFGVRLMLEFLQNLQARKPK